MKIEKLVAQVKQSTYPDWNVDIDRYLLEYTTRFLAAYTEKQEPVAWKTVVRRTDGAEFVRLDNRSDRPRMYENCGFKVGSPRHTMVVEQFPLYAAPVVPADMVRVPRSQYLELINCLEAMATGRGGWAWEDVLDEHRMIAAGEVKP